jgi:citrate synthase
MAVIEMLEAIHKGHLTPQEYLTLAKDKKRSIRLMGFGHRVYKNIDPRAKILRSISQKLLNKMGKYGDLVKYTLAI